jgi:hypothetical protein
MAFLIEGQYRTSLREVPELKRKKMTHPERIRNVNTDCDGLYVDIPQDDIARGSVVIDQYVNTKDQALFVLTFAKKAPSDQMLRCALFIGTLRANPTRSFRREFGTHVQSDRRSRTN